MAQMKAYSIVWENVVYEPGEAKIIAYNAKNKKVAEVKRVTAGKPLAIKIEAEVTSLKEGEVGVYVVSVVDKDGNLCSRYNKNMTIEVGGAAQFLASGNGDPTNVQNLSKPVRKLFNGQAVIYVQSNATGTISLKTISEDLQGTDNSIIVK